MAHASLLKLSSAYGDQGLPRLKIIMHPVQDLSFGASARTSGILFSEGDAIATTDLSHAAEKARAGSIFLVVVPENLYLGPAVFTTALVERDQSRVTGAPVRYMSGRQLLSFYSLSDFEGLRLQIENQSVNDYPSDSRNQLVLSSSHILGEFMNAQNIASVVGQLDGAVRGLRLFDFNQVESWLGGEIAVSAPAYSAMAASAIHGVVISAVEAMVIKRVRLLRWQGLALLGYKFYEGQNEINVLAANDFDQHRRRLDELAQQAASSNLLTGELSWLKDYIAHEIRIMSIELDAASW